MKCLLTGGHGNLGKELIRIADRYGIEYIVPERRDLDISSPHCVYTYHKCNNDNIDCVVHCAAYTNVPGAEANKKIAIDTNIFGTKNIANEFCQQNGVSLVYISTDYVYPGIKGSYKEIDITQPINFYALTKLAGEAYAGENDLVIRTSFKPRKWRYPRAFVDLFTSADFIDVIADKVSFLVAHKAKGIFNVGTERKSVYDIAKQCNPSIEPMSCTEITDVNLPTDTSMNIDKYNLFYEQMTRVGGK